MLEVSAGQRTAGSCLPTTQVPAVETLSCLQPLFISLSRLVVTAVARAVPTTAHPLRDPSVPVVQPLPTPQERRVELTVVAVALAAAVVVPLAQVDQVQASHEVWLV